MRDVFFARLALLDVAPVDLVLGLGLAAAALLEAAARRLLDRDRSTPAGNVRSISSAAGAALQAATSGPSTAVTCPTATGAATLVSFIVLLGLPVASARGKTSCRETLLLRRHGQQLLHSCQLLPNF